MARPQPVCHAVCFLVISHGIHMARPQPVYHAVLPNRSASRLSTRGGGGLGPAFVSSTQQAYSAQYLRRDIKGGGGGVGTYLRKS